MIRDDSRLPSQEKARKELLSTPIGFDALIEVGLLEKKGGWYIAKGRLPEHVTAQISAVKAVQGRVMMIKFRRGVRST